MPPIPVTRVISFTSQDPKHPVKDLVEGRGPWLSQPGDKSTRLQADLQLEQATKISFLDIGNAGSVMVGVEVGRSAWPSDRPFVTLIPTLTFMTRAEMTSGQNRNSVRMLKPENMEEAARNEEWDRVRVLCLQPFPSTSQYGLSMFRMYTEIKAQGTPKLQVTSSQGDHNLEVTLGKKNELMAKMNLSASKKSEISERIKSLEVNRLLDGTKESVKVHHPSSPLSRAAQLVTLAAKIPTQQETLAKKSELEREGLKFLMSLNMSVAEIDQLLIKDVRLRFEKKRQKPLNFAERKIFRDIAVDYAKRRLEVLENQNTVAQLAAKGVRTSEVPTKILQQKRKFHHSSTENKLSQEVTNSHSPSSGNKLTVKESKLIKRTDEHQQDNDSPIRRFTFGHSRNADKPLNVCDQSADEPEKKSETLSRTSVTPDKQKDVLPSRNALALLDAHVTPTRKKLKQRSKRAESKQQSLIGQWITPTNKQKLQEKNFQHSVRVLHSSSDSSDVECITEEDLAPSTPKNRTTPKNCSTSSHHKLTSSTSATASSKAKFSNLRAAPTSRSNTVVKGAEEIAVLSQQEQQCPLCSEFFPSEVIEAHAASCSITDSQGSHDSDGGSSPSRSSGEASGSGKMAECPVCRAQVAAVALESHATACATNMFD